MLDDLYRAGPCAGCGKPEELDEDGFCDECSAAHNASPEACPGCGCKPGEGLTEGCYHAYGCGYFRQPKSEAQREYEIDQEQAEQYEREQADAERALEDDLAEEPELRARLED